MENIKLTIEKNKLSNFLVSKFEIIKAWQKAVKDRDKNLLDSLWLKHKKVLISWDEKVKTVELLAEKFGERNYL